MTRTLVFIIAFVAIAPDRAVTAAPTTLTVGCGGGPGYDFSSLQAAVLTTVGQVGPTTIVVSGDCHERVTVSRAHNLTIEGTAGATLIDPGSTTPVSLVRVDMSSNVDIRELALVGPTNTGVTVSSSQVVRLIDCSLDGFGTGVASLPGSWTVVAGTTIANSQQRGVIVGRESHVEIVGAPHALTTRTTVIHDGAQQGIQVGGDAQVSGAVDIEDHGGPGIVVVHGGVLGLNGQGALHLRRNAFGLIVDGGAADVVGTRIEENRLGGMLQEGGHAVLRLGAMVVNNLGGSPRPPGFAPAGIVNHGGYLVLQGGAEVAGNAGFGVILSNNANGKIAGAIITGNSADGLRVQAGASLLLVSASGTANGRWDLSCSIDATAHGDKSGMNRARCPGFRNTLGGVVR